MVSNCLIEVIKAKLKNPKDIKIDYVPPYLNNGRLQKNKMSVEDSIKYIKKHHLHIPEDDVLDYFTLD